MTSPSADFLVVTRNQLCMTLRTDPLLVSHDPPGRALLSMFSLVYSYC